MRDEIPAPPTILPAQHNPPIAALVPSPDTNQNANAVITPHTTQETEVLSNLVHQMMQMQTNMIQHCLQTPSNNNNRTNNGGGRFNRGGRGRRDRNNRDGGRRAGRDNGNRGRGQRRQLHYCHTHGWTNHSSANCFYLGGNHQSTATLENRLDGSMEGLPPGYE